MSGWMASLLIYIFVGTFMVLVLVFNCFFHLTSYYININCTYMYINFAVMFGLLSSDSQEVIERNEVIRRVREWNPGFDPECLSTLFEVRESC